MSTGLECEFIETVDGEWWYILQNWDCPVMAWDWREHATGYGPFTSQEQADEHLRRNHANPGGHSTSTGVTPDEVLQTLINDARERRW